MEPPAPGNFWKTPFIWEPGCPEPSHSGDLRIAPVPDDWLAVALAQVMSSSLDESDRYAIAHLGPRQAVAELLDVLPQYFYKPDGWWTMAIDLRGDSVGLVLPVLFKEASRSREGKPQGTIFYMGVLPEHRGHGYAAQLVHQATRILAAAGCWRVFCDASSANAPMLNAFRQAGYKERTPWQRPVA